MYVYLKIISITWAVQIPEVEILKCFIFPISTKLITIKMHCTVAREICRTLIRLKIQYL